MFYFSRVRAVDLIVRIPVDSNHAPALAAAVVTRLVADVAVVLHAAALFVVVLILCGLR